MAKIKQAVGKTPKTEMHLGNLNISSRTIPEAKDWDIGDKVTVQVEIEVTGMHKPDKWDIEEQGFKESDVRINSDVISISSVK